MMKALITAGSLALALTLPSMGSAAELKPLQAGSFELGAQHVSIYYTAEDETFQVTTTIAPDIDSEGSPVRLVSVMRPGQTEIVSVGSFEAAASDETLELVHNGDRLTVVQTTQTALLK